MPEAHIPFAPADYDVGNWVSGKSCGTYLLGFRVSNLFGVTQSWLSNGAVIPFLQITTPEQGEALYNAMGKNKKATNLYAPQFRSKMTGLSFLGVALFGKRCVWARARSVTLRRGPLR